MAVPTTRKIYLNSSNELNDNLAGDAGKLLSRHNHRLYRQGRMYEIRVGVDADIQGVYEVYSLRPDWMVLKAWQKAFEAFMNNSKEEIHSAGAQRARWQDFRTQQLSLTGGNGEWRGTMRGTGSTNVSITSGEFVASEVHDENGNNLVFSWMNPTAAGIRFNILQEYANMGNTDDSPTATASAAAYSSIDNDSQDDQLLHLTSAGNEPPYDADGLEATTPLVKVATIGQVGPGTAVTSTGYFHAPCGLFIVRKISGAAPSDSNADFYFEAKAGTYKGVAAESMGTAKLVKNHYQVR